MTQYYIKNSGMDSNTGLSDAEAWGSIGKVNSFNFEHNDIISFRRGDIFTDGTLSLDGTSVGSSGITVQDYGTGNKPHIDGNTIQPICINRSLTDLTIKNIDISGQDWLNIVGDNVDINNIYNITLDGIEGNGHYNYGGINEGKNAIKIDYCSGKIEIKNCNLYNWGPSTIPSITEEDYSAIDIKAHNIGIFLMHDNLIHDIQSSALVRRTSYAIANVYDNTVYNCGQNFVNIKGSKNIEIYNNHAYREPDFTGSGGVITGIKNPFIRIMTGDDGDQRLTRNITIYNNLLGPTDQSIIYMWGNNETEKVDNITIKNNNIIGSDYALIIGVHVTNIDFYKNTVINSTGTHIFVWGGNTLHDVNIYNNTFHSTSIYTSMNLQNAYINLYNNIFYDDTISYMIDLNSGNPSIHNNIWYNTSNNNYINWKGTIYTSSQQTAWRNAGHPGAIFANPKFIDAENGDFRLQPTSPAIDTGIDAGIPFIGSAPDIGALEYGYIDLCAGVVCDNICIGKDLWFQKCVDGICVADQLIESNSATCEIDPCIGVVCESVCIDNDLWSQRCDPYTGKCMLNQLIENNSSMCMGDLCAGVVCPNICLGNDLWSQKCDSGTGACVLDQLILQNATNCIISDLVPSDDSTIQRYLLLGGIGLAGLAILMLGKNR